MADELTTEQKFRLFHNSEMAKLIRAMKEQFGDGVFDVVAKQNGEKAYQDRCSQKINIFLGFYLAPSDEEAAEVVKLGAVRQLCSF